MKKALIIGHLGVNNNLQNGQTIKTRIFLSELEKKYGKNMIEYIDTHNIQKRFFSVLFQCLKKYNHTNNVLIFPGANGIRIFVPLLYVFNFFRKKNLIYVVIGGWLPEFIEKKALLRNMLNSFSVIYVETEGIKNKLVKMNLKNIEVLPNFKNLKIVSSECRNISNQSTFRFCTFSRVMKEKGIEDAVDAVTKLHNDKFNCELDIYGQVDKNQVEWFEQLEKTFPNYIKYRGIVDYSQTSDILQQYFALLFPTYYEGEGFAGTLIDAMAAGIPVIASDWKYNNEIILPGKTGLLCIPNDSDDLKDKIELMISDKENWVLNRSIITDEAMKYLPENVLGKLEERLR